MTPNIRRRRLVMGLVAVVLIMGIAYPLLFRAPPTEASQKEKAMLLLYGLSYVTGMILVAGAAALIAAREIREVLEQYRQDRKSAIRNLVQSLAKRRNRESSNGHPLE